MYWLPVDRPLQTDTGRSAGTGEWWSPATSGHRSLALKSPHSGHCAEARELLDRYNRSVVHLPRPNVSKSFDTRTPKYGIASAPLERQRSTRSRSRDIFPRLSIPFHPPTQFDAIALGLAHYAINPSLLARRRTPQRSQAGCKQFGRAVHPNPISTPKPWSACCLVRRLRIQIWQPRSSTAPTFRTLSDSTESLDS